MFQLRPPVDLPNVIAESVVLIIALGLMAVALRLWKAHDRHLPWLGLQSGGDFVIVDHGAGTFFTSTEMGYSVTGSTRRM